MREEYRSAGRGADIKRRAGCHDIGVGRRRVAGHIMHQYLRAALDAEVGAVGHFADQCSFGVADVEVGECVDRNAVDARAGSPAQAERFLSVLLEGITPRLEGRTGDG